MGIFSKTTTPNKRYVIFLVEDNMIYAKQLEFFLKSKFDSKADIMYFPVSEVLDVKFEADIIPDVIIMDHFLNEKYNDASLGYTALQKIKKQYPQIELILHTSQESIDLAITAIKDKVCRYVSKNKEAFGRLEDIVNEIIK